MKYTDRARKVIEVLLTKYQDEGIEEMENSEILKVSPINKLGRPLEIMKLFTDLNKKGKTIILVTHDLGLVRYGRKTLKMKDGRIVKW